MSIQPQQQGVTQCHVFSCQQYGVTQWHIFISPAIMQFRGFSSNLMKWNFCSDTEFLLFRLLVKSYEISCATQVRCLVYCRSDNNFKLTGKWNYRSISNAGSQAYSMSSFPKCEKFCRNPLPTAASRHSPSKNLTHNWKQFTLEPHPCHCMLEDNLKLVAFCNSHIYI